MPVLRAGSSAVSSGSTASSTLAFTIPSGAVPGDTVAIWVATPNTGLTWSVPGSPAFTAQAQVTGAASNACQLLTRVMDGTEGWTPGTSTVTVTLSSGTKFQAGVILAASGYADPPLSGSGQCNTSASLTITTPGVTTGRPGDLLVWLGFNQANAGGTPGTITVPAGFAAQVTQASTSGTGSSVNAGILMGTGTSASAGATGNQNGSSSVSEKSGGLLLSFASYLPVQFPAGGPGLTWQRHFQPQGQYVPLQQSVPPPAPPVSGTPTYFPPQIAPGPAWRQRFWPAGQTQPGQAAAPPPPVPAVPAPAAPGLTWLRRFRPGSQQAAVAAPFFPAVAGTAALSGTGSAYAPVTPGLTWSPGLCGPVTRPITFGAPVASGTAALSGTGTLTALGGEVIPATAAVSGSGTLTAAGASVQAVSFVIAAVAGDNSSAGTALTPAGWTPLHTVTASNGTDRTGDTVLAAACTTLQVASVTATATSSSGEDMSGMILGVICGAPSPVPAGINPNWPYVIFEAAFGSGYQTPPDEMTWTNLQTLAAGLRCRKWDETTGIQYELDALESSEVDLILDNPDGYLSPENPSSPYYPHVVPGTPVRLRVVPPPATETDAWMIIQRNAERWPQSWDYCYRGIVNATGNDQWAVISKILPTCYRAEVLADSPYAWWPCDDPLITPVPTQLVNAAVCNSNHLQVVASPNGLNVTGTIPTSPVTYVIYSATETFAASSGWMYGDPVSAAWQQSGNGGGTAGRYLSCNDVNFPPLSGGVTIEGWFNLGFAATGSGEIPGPIGQPAGSLVLWEIASATGSVAVLSVTASGFLQLAIGGTTTTIYSGADLRNGTWFTVSVAMTTTSWQAWVNGGVIATASGTFGAIGGTWTWFLANAGTGGSGGPPASSTITGCGNCQFSHLEVYPQVLPAARVMAHAMGAYAAFGQLPAPSLTAAYTAVPFGSEQFGYGPDGKEYDGQFFVPPTIASVSNSTIAALVTSTGGGYSSSVSAPETICIVAGTETSDGYIWLAASGIAPSYEFFTSAGAGNEKLAGTEEAAYLYCDSYGTGAAPPSAASALGDTAQNRIERLLQAGNVTTPQRCIDASATAIVAELDTGGQACGTAVSNIVASDGSFMFIDTCGNLCVFDRPHLAAMPVTWVLGENTAGGEIPYEPDAEFDTDPQQCRNDIALSQSSVAPDSTAGTGGSSSGSAEQTTTGVTFSPDATRAVAVQASIRQNGDCQFAETNYLQSTTEIQNRANWLFDVFGVPVRRITNLTVNAASKTRTAPQAWVFLFAANPGDIVQATRRPPGQASFTGQWRISQVKRTIDFSAGIASITIIADVLPSYYPA